MKLFFTILLLTSLVFCQEKVYKLGYLYLGSDTLDIEDLGCTKTKVTFSSISVDTLLQKYIIEGQITDEQTDEVFDSIFGRIFLGQIGTVEAKTWVGYTKTGLLKRNKEYTINGNGYFRIKLPFEEQNYLIFTGIGCNVKSYSVEEIKSILQIEKSCEKNMIVSLPIYVFWRCVQMLFVAFLTSGCTGRNRRAVLLF